MSVQGSSKLYGGLDLSGQIFYESKSFDVEFGTYPNNEPTAFPPYWPGVSALYVRQFSLYEFVQAMFYVDALRARGNAVSKLVLPLVPGSRQDRLNSSGDYLFTLKSVADMINQRKFEQVHILDPHSDVTPGLIDNVIVHTAAEVLRQFRNTFNWAYDGVIAPDAGAEKRAFDVAKMLGTDNVVRAWKHRNVEDGKISGFGMEPAGAGHYLVVDDLCDAGGTFLGLGQVIKDQAITADLYVSHGLFTDEKKFWELQNFYKRVLTTDSVVSRPSSTRIVAMQVKYIENGEF